MRNSTEKEDAEFQKYMAEFQKVSWQQNKSYKKPFANTSGIIASLTQWGTECGQGQMFEGISTWMSKHCSSSWTGWRLRSAAGTVGLGEDRYHVKELHTYFALNMATW
jgi:hypothetical protein